MNIHRIQRGLVRTALLLGTALGAGAVMAQIKPITINSAPTTLNSTADRMISYREQSHMWQTADGGTHVLINKGGTGPSSLALNSSYDGGATWNMNLLMLAQSDLTTTSDGYLDNNDLYVTYSGLANPRNSLATTIWFAHMKYDLASKTWAAVDGPQLVFSGSAAGGVLTPAVATDAMGTRWLAFTNKANGIYTIKMMRQDAGSSTWVDTGFTFGKASTDGGRSGRPVQTTTGMGLIYTLGQSLYWSQRSNASPPTAQWSSAIQIYKNQYNDGDPYGTHFSTTTDPQSNLHLVWVDGGQIFYSRYLASTQVWEPAARKSQNVQASYMQVVSSMDNILIIYNNGTNLFVDQSSDHGAHFSHTQTLQHPPASGNTDYSFPREEAPGRSTSPIPVLQQYAVGQIQRALFFPVPVIRVPTK